MWTMNKYRPVFCLQFANNEHKHSHVSTVLRIALPLPSQITLRINAVFPAVNCGIQMAKSWAGCLDPGGINLLVFTT